MVRRSDFCGFEPFSKAANNSYGSRPTESDQVDRELLGMGTADFTMQQDHVKVSDEADIDYLQHSNTDQDNFGLKKEHLQLIGEDYSGEVETITARTGNTTRRSLSDIRQKYC